jgi:putative thioredoxin
LIEGFEEGGEFYERAQNVRTLLRVLQLAPAPELTASAAWSDYAKGNAALREGNYAKAFAAWIETVQLDRKLDDDGARRACVALFNVLGNEHPLVQEYRRKFSSALY